MTELMDGRMTAKKVEDDLKIKIGLLRERGKRTPQLTVVLVGDHPASLSYVAGKDKACQRIGMNSEVLRLPRTISQTELIKVVQRLNDDSQVDGILVQLPLPAELDPQEVVRAIDPSKDVDGLHPINVGLMHMQLKGFEPCTPRGILRLLDEYQIPLQGKDIVVIGRSNLVGRPVAQLLLNRNATVTVCHSKTADLQRYTRAADVVVVAIGRPHFLRKEHVSSKCVVIDVGINRLENGKLTGDADFDALNGYVSHITPVPGGVGPMTIAMLLENTMDAYYAHEALREV
ncbi:MAG: bifunctional methylenetetrahydrofolate dehydrogenase/methenyltetrahydrofolate cyclohydrolase [Firmicutes bacterium GWF2_51_9]|nr:MAG: bifunctional methylenetetrahydrofolate dehydrogenase/methenyltetrahydrofolate cyclohydrolase [Firmicutes bacterium GWF2_51_9]OGS58170.1 MAG: bifunctional methylenetetrahydrofolate dehydrogenase/methenyltetrahydrofolate cyclohydrolase [Firmicutes bacterium GWE2_51_13]HAM63549.1 bifunctional methylenetetrahydrofolate dehydrogenase/methenyltetrahydrofolate cyclohydrolase FolD [Erysipelotrichaceae bacterium]HBZ42147.1 bifunctional methylenetetrahydrofolate dehydrogenase/methenyltetrahydrofol